MNACAVALKHKIYQYQRLITSSMAVTKVSMHYSKVNFSRAFVIEQVTISYQRKK